VAERPGPGVDQRGSPRRRFGADTGGTGSAADPGGRRRSGDGSSALREGGVPRAVRPVGPAAGVPEKGSPREEAYDLFLKSVDAGDIVWVEGPLFLTRTGELTVEAARFRLLTKAIRPLPEKWHGLSDIETRYRQRYVDLIVNEDVREIFRRRARIVSFIRSFLTARDFLEVETPMMQTVAGGATARPFVTHHNALDMDLYLRIAPSSTEAPSGRGVRARLRDQPELPERGDRHPAQPEFTMIEFYQAYATYREMMELTEEMLSSLATELFGSPMFTYQGRRSTSPRPGSA